MSKIKGEIASLTIPDTSSPFRELALVCIVSYGALGVTIFESFGFGKSEADLSR